MKNSILFAIDLKSKETIISESEKGSNKVIFIERIASQENEMLYNAVITLTSIVNSPDFDVTIFKAMDKVCQMVYAKHRESE
jgi:hypothetical protein